jgi:hypothetical protein
MTMTPDRVFQVETEQQQTRLCAFLGRQSVPFQVALGPLRKQRSTSQNARWWLLLGKAAEVSGHSPEELHELCLCRHFGYTEKEVTDLLTGEVTIKRVPLKRSSARDTKEFRELMDDCEAWLGETLGVWLEQA